MMRRRMRNPHQLKVRLYAACMIGLNNYLGVFPVSKAIDKIGETKLNGILLKSIRNGCSKQAYVHGFCYEAVTLKRLSILLNAWRFRKPSMKVLYNIPIKLPEHIISNCYGHSSKTRG